MKFILEITNYRGVAMGAIGSEESDHFDAAMETARLLRLVSKGLERDCTLIPNQAGTLYDYNGNQVGHWKVTGETE